MTIYGHATHPQRRSMPSLIAIALTAALLPSLGSAATVIDPSPKTPHVTFQLFQIPGVYGSGYMTTEFFCTSLESKEVIRVGIDVLDDDGVVRNPGATNGKLDVGPGQTVTISAGDSPAFSEDQVLTLSHSVENGSARIYSNSHKLMCGAVLVENEGAPPAAMVELRVIRPSSRPATDVTVLRAHNSRPRIAVAGCSALRAEEREVLMDQLLARRDVGVTIPLARASERSRIPA